MLHSKSYHCNYTPDYFTPHNAHPSVHPQYIIYNINIWTVRMFGPNHISKFIEKDVVEQQGKLILANFISKPTK